MPDIKSTIEKLKSESELLSERIKEIIQYLLDTTDADIEDETLSDDKLDDYLAEYGFAVYTDDIIELLKWRTGQELKTNIDSTIDNLEKLGSDRHNAVKSMERDITDLRHYRKQIKEIASICDDTVSRIDALLKLLINTGSEQYHAHL